MKIVLLSTSFEEFANTKRTEEEEIEFTDEGHYALGIGYLHSYMESRGHEVQSGFYNNFSYAHSWQKCTEMIDAVKPDVLGLQIMTQNRTSTAQIIEYAREKYPNTRIVLGGIHVTALPAQLAKKYPFAVCVLGEGEITLGELVDAFEHNTPLENVKGIAFYKDGAVITTAERPLIHNLDDLPFPKHDSFFTEGRDTGCILTSRGCPFKCNFCMLDSVSRRSNRTRSIKNCMEEIEFMIKKFPQMRRIWIHDDTFFLNNQRAIEFCDEVIARKFNLEFVASSRVKPLCEELVMKLEQANFTKVLVGLESGDNRVLKLTHKAITQDDVLRAFNLFAKTKIEVYAFLIVGLPGETKETLLETARFVKKLQRIKYMYYHDVGVLMVYPGTEVYRMMEQKGLINDDYWLTDKPVPYYTVDYTVEELFEFKEILLDHISFERALTPRGLKAQRRMIPAITKFLWSKRKSITQRITGREKWVKYSVKREMDT